MNDDDPRIDDAARRVQDAVTAHGRSVQPDEDGSLPVIRHRVASARRRRLVGATALGAAAALVIGVAIGVAAGGDDTTTVAVGDGGSTTTTEPCPPSTLSPSSTTTTVAPSTASIPTTSTAPDPADAGGPSTIVPANAPLTAVPETTIPAPAAEEEVLEEEEWNCAGPTTSAPTTTTTTAPTTTTTTGGGLALCVVTVFPSCPVSPEDVSTDPVRVARAFFDEVVGAHTLTLGPFESTDPDEGSITAYPTDPDGSVRTDVVRSVLNMIRNDGQWYVETARTPSIVLDKTIGSVSASGAHQVTLSGRGRGYEGTLHVSLIGQGEGATRVDGIAMASGDEELRPFTTTLDLPAGTSAVVTVLITTDSGEDGSPVDVAALAFHLR